VTLIELLVVITILGVLAAIVTFSVAGLQSNGNQAACKTDTATIRTAQEAYRSQNPNYASDVGQLVTAGFLGTNSEWHNVAVPGTDPDGAGPLTAPAYDVTTKTGVTKCGGDGVATHVVDNATYF